MPNNLLTDRAVRAAKPRSTVYEIQDGAGLELRIMPTGAKTWRWRGTVKGNTTRRSLGPYPAVSLGAAREAALKLQAALAQAPVQLAVSSDAPRDLDALFESWFIGYVCLVRKSANDRASVKSRYYKHVSPKLGRLSPDDLNEEAFLSLLDGMVKTGIERQASLVLTESKQMLRYGAKRRWLKANFLAEVEAKDLGVRRTRSDRFLSLLELSSLKEILHAPAPASQVRSRPRLPPRTELAVWLAVSTLARSVEIATAHVRHVDLKRGLWRVPAEVAKNRLPHVIHLNGLSKAVFGRLLADPSKEGWLFPGRREREGSYVQPTAFTRELTDRQGRERPLKGRRNSEELVLPGGRWSMHDLRRTGATMMGELGYDKDLIDLCLNHQEENEVKATYQLQKRMPERARAFEALGVKLLDILGGVDWLPTLERPRRASLRRAERA